MRNASAALTALINSGVEFYVADCLTLVRADGSVYRFTSAPEDVTVVSQYDNAAHTFLANGGLKFRRGPTKLVVGLEVDDMDLTLIADADVAGPTIGGVALPWPTVARLGYLDEASIMLERVFTQTWRDNSAGTLIMFSGALGEIMVDRLTIATRVKSDLSLLALSSPRNQYQPGCLHALFDAGCTLSAAAFTVAGTAQAGSTAIAIATGLAAADAYYALGGITFTSGPNAGVTRTVKSYLANVAQLTQAFPNADVVGRSFSISAGCDKVQATCSGKFANLAHFRGYPYIPTPENAR